MPDDFPYFDDDFPQPINSHHILEQAEERILQTNHSIARIGGAGILADDWLAGPVINIEIPDPKVRHLIGSKYARSAIDPCRGLGVLIVDAELVTLPKASESWDLLTVQDGDLFVRFERCSLSHRLVLVDRHLCHLRHLLAVMRQLSLGQPVRPAPIEEYFMNEPQTFPTPIGADEHAAALDDLLKLLARLLAQKHIERRDQEGDSQPTED